MQKNIKKIIFTGIISSLLFNPFILQASSPAIETGNVSNISDTNAILHGSGTPDLALNPKLPTTVYFRYTTAPTKPIFCNDIYGSNMISTRDIPLDINGATQSVSQPILGLDHSTTYYYCAIISNKNKIAYGEVKEFTTVPCSTCAQTTVETTGSQVVGQNSAWLKGKYSSTKAVKTYFEYKEDTSFLSNTEVNVAWIKASGSEKNHNANTLGDISFLLSGLKPNTKYSFRLIVETKESPAQIFGDNTFLSFTTFAGSGANGLTTDPGTGSGNGYTYEPTGWAENIIGGSGVGVIGTVPGSISGQTITPPTDAVVRFQEGVETVFARQIIANQTLAKMYGYKDGQDITAFAWELADLFARAFGYVSYNGKEIRVSFPDIAAYQLVVVGNKLYVYEYFNEKIVNVQIMTEILRNNYAYEYYFFKR